MTDTLAGMATDLDLMKSDLDSLRSFRENGISPSGVAAFGFNATDITSTTPVAILAAAGAGFKWRIRRVRVVNKTAAETATISIEDDTGSPVTLLRMVATNPATTSPDDTGWMDIPVESGENKAILGAADGSNGDTIVSIWAEKVAV